MSTLLKGLAVSVGASALVAASAAAGAPADVAFKIPGGSLDEVLRSYALATGRQLLYRASTLGARRSPGLSGRMDRDVALRRILAGSGLVVRSPSPNVFVISDERDSAELRPVSPPASAEESPEIVVTGSNIRGATATGAVRTIDRRELELTGRGTVAEAVAAQTANFGGTGNPVATLTGSDRSSINSSMAPAADLRGLGSDATLTLFNGRRVAGSGGKGDFSDLSAVPTMAVDRVEILADGASAIYGSDAVGGVVNVIMRTGTRGLEARVRPSEGTGGRVRGLIAGGLAATTWTGGSVLLAYEYEHKDPLRSGSRPYAATGDLRPFGGSDRRTYQSSPATILALSQALRAYVPAYKVPVLPAGRQPTVADLVPGANLSNLYAGLDLSPRWERHAGYASVRQVAGPDIELFAEARYARRTFKYDSPGATTIMIVTRANPYFLPVDGQSSTALGYSFFPEAGPVVSTGQVSALSASAGATWRAGRAWRLDMYGTYSRERSSERSSNTLNSALLSEALGTTADNPLTAFSARRNGYFNPYGSGSSNPRSLIDLVTSGYTRAARRSSIEDIFVKADGPLLKLPSGSLKIAVGAAARRESLSSNGEVFASGIVPVPSRPLDASRAVRAVFGELMVPLAGAEGRTLQVSLAARHEWYDDFGQTTNPRVGLLLRPVADLAIRATWGTSFRAPALPEVNARRLVTPTSLPDAAGIFRPAIFVSGGNDELGPERARTLSAGLVLTPSAAPGLSMEVNAFRTVFRERIGQPVLQDLLRALTNPALSPFVQRVSPAANAADLALVQALLAEPGAGSSFVPATSYVAIADGRFVNTASLEVSGIDWDLRYARRLGADALSLAISATWLFAYSERLTPDSAKVDRLDTLSNPVSLRARAIAGWSRGAFSSSLVANYVDGYVDNGSVRQRPIGAFMTFDAVMGYTAEAGLMKGTRVGVNVLNLFDRAPPFVDRVNGIGFDSANASPSGRVVSLEVSRSF